MLTRNWLSRSDRERELLLVRCEKDLRRCGAASQHNQRRLGPDLFAGDPNLSVLQADPRGFADLEGLVIDDDHRPLFCADDSGELKVIIAFGWQQRRAIEQ